MDEEGVPEDVIIMKRIPVDEYITFLTSALAEAKDAGLCHGRTSSIPSDVQKSLMAEVMNGAGYYSTKWIGYCCTKEEKMMDQIKVDEDGDEKDELMKDIMKRLYTRKSARNARLVCAVTRTGGCTKSFPSRVGLARYLIDECGEHWYRNVKLINNDGEPQGLRTTMRPSVAPDLEGSYNIIGRLVFNGQTYAVLDAPHDGSCFYHSFLPWLGSIWEVKHRDDFEEAAEGVLQAQRHFYEAALGATVGCVLCRPLQRHLQSRSLGTIPRCAVPGNHLLPQVYNP